MAIRNHGVGNKHVPDKASVMFNFAPSDDSEQPGHPSSLLRVLVEHMKNVWFHQLFKQRIAGCPVLSEYSKTCLKRLLKKRQNNGFKDKW